MKWKGDGSYDNSDWGGEGGGCSDGSGARSGLVDHERVRLHGRGRVVERVRVLRRLALQLTLVGQCAGAAVAEEAVVPDELDVVARVARFDAVDADGVAVGRVARPTAVEVVHWKRRVRRDLV